MYSGDELKLFIHNNAHPVDSKVFVISASASINTLRRDAAEKLGILRPQKLYTSSGVEIERLDVLKSNDHVYVSSGELFYKQLDISDGSIVRVSILGAGGVGKSAITLRFVRDFFVQNWEATIEDAYRKSMKVDGSVVSLEILDTAGQEDFSTLRAQWMMDKEGYIFVYSLVDKESIDQLYSFIDLLEQVCEGLQRVPPIIFVGNKKDLTDSNPASRAVTSEDIARLIHACEAASARVIQKQNDHKSDESRIDSGWPILHFEASALSGERIDEMFEILVREIKDRRNPTSRKKKDNWFSRWCTVV
jgi:small GTP-binding protein